MRNVLNLEEIVETGRYSLRDAEGQELNIVPMFAKGSINDYVLGFKVGGEVVFLSQEEIRELHKFLGQF